MKEDVRHYAFLRPNLQERAVSLCPDAFFAKKRTP
jgi:hypothetical protein